jgi:hypothetical protein
MQPIQYVKPVCTDTAVCLCFFSPAGFQNPKKNFLYIEKMLKNASIPYFTAECVIGNQRPLLQTPTIRTYSNSCMFYKEQLYNKLVPLVPDQYTKLIFIDGDILFSDSRWVDSISNVLNTHDVVQPFQFGKWFRSGNRIIIQEFYSTTYGLKHKTVQPHLSIKPPYHPGFTFAMTRSFYNKIEGFFDKCIFGGGDAMFINLFDKGIQFHTRMKMVDSEYIKWLRNANSIPCMFTYLPCTVYHLYHGTIANRGYETRYNYLKQFDTHLFDNLFFTNESGMYETNHPILNSIMKDYFLSRNEDK